MQIDYINGPKTEKIFGMSKYQMEIHKRLDVELNIIEYESIMHNLEKRYSPPLESNLDKQDTETQEYSQLKNFFIEIGRTTFKNIDRYRYKIKVQNNIKKQNIKHITSQENAYLLNSIKTNRSVVTCYDLIPWAFEKNHSRLWKSNMSGLKKADRIMTISEFSKDEIVKYLNYPEERIHIVSAAVDHDLYHKKRNKDILIQHNIPKDQKFILYVGSETPRQNLNFLLRSLVKLKKKLPGIKLLKIGDPQSYGARKQLLKTIIEMGLQNDIIFIGYVSEEELPKWYNASDLLVYPCLYAGFGLPPLEAMACGTPVITSNTSSLPEVVDDAGIMVDPNDEESLALNMYNVLTQDDLNKKLAEKGLKRSKIFTWDNAARETQEVYNSISGD
ncbi:glycosyltransferase family 1 protein [Methanobacterium sp. SMA-27]|uniref:glycosyltransferase family 4 protein n=1 Tax=Methanobacterium sp. SMA-27 TaxID=1495336 RepID=UPI00064F20AE|nr:glycosyltransferase family 1 protein [Methanobacterium sp. SMA-27]